MIKVPAVKTTNGWVKDRYTGAWVTYDYESMEKMRLAMEADIEKCGCGGAKPGPVRHAAGFVNDIQGYTYHCRSWCRWYNPETEKMEGSSHCTCDSCF